MFIQLCAILVACSLKLYEQPRAVSRPYYMDDKCLAHDCSVVFISYAVSGARECGACHVQSEILLAEKIHTMNAQMKTERGWTNANAYTFQTCRKSLCAIDVRGQRIATLERIGMKATEENCCISHCLIGGYALRVNQVLLVFVHKAMQFICELFPIIYSCML